MDHVSVLLKEVIEYLDPRPGDNFIDATFGGGGHALAILKRVAPQGRVLGLDWDCDLLKSDFNREGQGPDSGSANLKKTEPQNVLRFNNGERSRSGVEPRAFGGSDELTTSAVKTSPFAGLFLECANFAAIAKVSRRYFDCVNGVLFDLGFSSWHLEHSGRGFSYLRDEPLDMRFHRMYEQRINPNITNRNEEITAATIINSWPEKELARIFREYGEERNAKRIARGIVRARQSGRIATADQLVAAVDMSNKTNRLYGVYRMKILARVFQALRMAVNNELENIASGLAGAWEVLSPGGRLAVISFHSLEDRLVKQFFNQKNREGRGEVLTKKPVRSSAAEIGSNPRARSAKLRAVMKK